MHLTIDARTGRPVTVDVVNQFLVAVPGMLRMTPITPPIVKDYEGDVHGIVLIAESHISVHAAASGEVHLDVFSCKPFDDQHTLEFCRRWFDLTDILSHVIHDRLDLDAIPVVGGPQELVSCP